MNIAVLGSGNIGTLISAQLSLNDKVNLYSRKPEKFNSIITVFDEDTNTEYKSKINMVSDNLEKVLINCELVIITVPAFAIKDLIVKVFKIIDIETKILFYPGTGGVEFYCKDFIKKGGKIYGTQRVCSVARLKEYGKSVITSGKRNHMFVGSIPNNCADELKKVIENKFDIDTTVLPNYLSVTLTPSNPILHTSRLYSIFEDYNKECGYKYIPLFYEEWDNKSSEILIDADNEVQRLCRKINLDLNNVKSLLEHYESKNKEELTKKIISIKSLKGISTPSIFKNEQLHPDLDSRYFTADFPYGLMVIKAICLIYKMETPMIDKMLFWYQKLVKKEYLVDCDHLGIDSKEISIPQDYDLKTPLDIETFYNKEY